MSRVTRKITLKKGTRRTVAATLVISFAVFYGLFKASTSHHSSDRELASATALAISSLGDSYSTGGISSYLKQKEILRNKVSWAMEKQDPRAEPIAVYLFPELLSDDNFEKSVALAGWIPLQSEIESRFGTPESREIFEEMRAQIWIYENPDHKTPTLSDTADEVVKLFDRLSSQR